VGFVPDGCATDSVGRGGGGGGWLFRSSVGWQTATGLFSSPSPHKSATDDLSSIMMRLRGAGRWLLWLLQSLTPLVRSGDGSWRASSSRFGARVATGRRSVPRHREAWRSDWKIKNFVNRSSMYLFANSWSFKVFYVFGDVLGFKC
jgi:hypothetical protein